MAFMEQKHRRAWSVDRPWLPREWQTWAVLGGGGLLIAYGFMKRNRAGLASSLAGAALMYRGVEMKRNPEANLLPDTRTAVEVRRTVSIQRPRQELYDFWADPKNFEDFMIDVESVTATGPGRQHWVMKFPVGPRLEFDSEVQQTGDTISWHTTPDSPIEHYGSIDFVEGTHPGETIVRFDANYQVPGGFFTRGVAKLAGRDPEQMARENLRRFKQLMEAGEIATTAGQPSGRSPFRNKLTESFYHENLGVATKRSA